MLLPIVLLNGKKALCAEAAMRAAMGFAPLWARAMCLSPAGAAGAVVACEAMGSGDRDGFVFGAAGEASVFKNLFEGNPDAESFVYAIPVVVW